MGRGVGRGVWRRVRGNVMGCVMEHELGQSPHIAKGSLVGLNE